MKIENAGHHKYKQPDFPAYQSLKDLFLDGTNNFQKGKFVLWVLEFWIKKEGKTPKLR